MGNNSSKHYWEHIPVKGTVAKVGKGLAIGYKSAKWDGKLENYMHDFEKAPNMYLHEDKETLILHPVKFDNRGITS